MSRIWTHVDGFFDRAAPTATQQTNPYNNHASAIANDPSSSSSSPGLTSFIPPAAILPAREMPTSSVRSLFSKSSSLTTNISNISSKFGLSLPSSITRGFRARSEPLPKKDEDVQMDKPEHLPRAHSEYNMGIPPKAFPCDTTNDTYATEKTESIEEEEEEESSQSLFNARRAPSPALTEADNQDPLYTFTRLDDLGIIRRDYAFAPPYSSKPNPAVFQKRFDEENAPEKPLEIFDQFKGLTEIDYRWTQPSRTYPVSGKTLRRLLDMGWLSMQELRTRGHPMDFNELEKATDHPMHPWKPFKGRSSPLSIPSAAERRDMLTAKRGYWFQFDRQRSIYDREMKNRMEEQKKMDAILTEEDKRRIGKGKAREMSSSSGTKRPLEEDTTGGGKAINTTKAYGLENGNPAKRRRITPERELASSLIPLDPALDPHRQQRMPPVPRPASSSQPRPGERDDTPPVEEPQSQGAQGSPGRGTKLVHPKHKKAMKRALSRTQTFAQL